MTATMMELGRCDIILYLVMMSMLVLSLCCHGEDDGDVMMTDGDIAMAMW